jgi:hypothetical protein
MRLASAIVSIMMRYRFFVMLCSPFDAGYEEEKQCCTLLGSRARHVRLWPVRLEELQG